MNMDNLNSFLKFGYFLDYKSPVISLNLSGINRELYQDIDERQLIELGSDLWRESISSNFELNKTHLVPISGGLDSRAILANLLEHTEARNIYTYTFGTPKTLDYEIGNYIAKKFGTKHTSFPLTEHKYSLKEEIEVSKQIDHQTFLFHHPPVFELEKLFSGTSIWSGYILDWIAGSHLPGEKSKSIEQAKRKAFHSEVFVNSINLSNVKDKELTELFDCDFINSDVLSFEEQIEAEHHLVKYTAPHILYNKFEYKTPVTNQKLFNFFLGVEDKHRFEQGLYKKVLLNSFPKAFSYKTKTNLGLPLGASNAAIACKRMQYRVTNKLGITRGHGINYLDFSQKIRNKIDLKELIVSSVLDLKKRNIVTWVDMESILDAHMKNKANCTDALIVLASLEIHLKSGLKL